MADSQSVIDRANKIFEARIQREWDKYRTERNLTGKSSTPPNAWYDKGGYEWEESLEEALRG